jgi:hypothetical protein
MKENWGVEKAIGVNLTLTILIAYFTCILWDLRNRTKNQGFGHRALEIALCPCPMPHAQF